MFKHAFFFLFSKTMSTQMPIASFKGMFVNQNWMSKDVIKRFGSWSRISLQTEKGYLQTEKGYLTVYSLTVNYFNSGTKKFASL